MPGKTKELPLREKQRFAEEAAKKGDSKMVYRLTNEIVGKKTNRTSLVKDENGDVISDPQKADERWASHFEKVLNRPRPDDPETVPDTPFLQIDVSADPPSTVEVTTAVKKLKNGRAPGVDGITAEMLKASLRACMFVWTALLVAIWNNEKVPKDWTRGILVKLFKKGDAQICDNWRGINLTSVPSKILASVILQRLRAALDSHLREEQHGFRPGRSCSDLIFILRLMVEESREWNKKLYLLFIDFEKAFDSVDRDTLWKILKYYGVPDKLVKMIIALYEDSECCVRTENGDTRFFKIMSGVKQGCVLSPFLFVIVMDYILRQSSGIGVKISSRLISDLDFADDVVLLEEAKLRLQLLLDAIDEKAEKMGLAVNVSKTKSMATSDSPLILKCKNKTIEQVKEFKYLGSWIEYDGEIANEIKRKIGQATSAFSKLKPVWRSSKYSMRLKLRLLNSNVMSILLYASECWKLNTQLEKRVLAFENMCLRRILNISWQEKVTNIEVRRRTGQPLVTDLLKRRRWTYLGHVLRMPEDRLPNTVYDWRPEGRRKRGRPRHTLRRQYDRDLRNAELSLQPQWEDVMAAAQLRDVWRGFVDAL